MGCSGSLHTLGCRLNSGDQLNLKYSVHLCSEMAQAEFCRFKEKAILLKALPLSVRMMKKENRGRGDGYRK